MDKKSYYNCSLLLLHEKHLENYSLYELFKIRHRFINNNNFIVEKLNHKIIIIIDNVILLKQHGNKLLQIINENNMLYRNIKLDDIKFEENMKLLNIYNNINLIEDILNLKKDSLLSSNQITNRIYLTSKVFINNLIEKIILCKLY